MAKKIKRPIRPLLQLKRVEKHIAENKHMSGLISNLYNEQSGKLDYSWKDGYSTGVKDTEGLYKPQIKEKDAKLLEQAVKHQKSITKLKSELEAKESTNQIAMVQGETLKTGFLVPNWKHGWKWISTWLFALIGYIQLYGIPPELLQLLPGSTQPQITALLAVMGFAFRFVNQSKPTSLEPLPEDKGGA
ncbi:hypothetical protein F892_03097 [Acinetobacter vivianii]|uniref:Uncharacterized protein n=1 Tax=Acinetobacter vivianii TaxID=1776742 RepID=N9NGH6_9GAMM|nr:hypothetical protein [Acinetobacter vivianii]ENX20174.1 hypothetical protein F892_03097 [Acinetobacter vivianii]GGI59378.1 hypothetical protein GCM10011446_08730 [Acinetobacter vivianii]